MEEFTDSVERLFGEGGIRSQLRQQEIVGSDHFGDRSRRAGKLGQDHIERLSDQRQTVDCRGRRKSKLTEYNPMTLEDQRAAIDQSAVEIEDYQLHVKSPMKA